jgi:cyclic pyranopterin phosphate synthase
MEPRGKQDSVEIEGIVDIGRKPSVARRAVAEGWVTLRPETLAAIVAGGVPKGDVREASTIAAIQAVKETPRLIPHCHPVPIESCKVRWHVEGDRLGCEVDVGAHYRTGIEMEALAGVSAGLLCAFDMVKSMEKDEAGQYPVARIDGLRVVEKHKANP